MKSEARGWVVGTELALSSCWVLEELGYVAISVPAACVVFLTSVLQGEWAPFH